MTTRPPPRRSGRAPKREPPEPPLVIDPQTVYALELRMLEQRAAETLPRHPGRRAARLSRAASDLELAVITKKPIAITRPLCIEVAALALRIFEEGD